jgi:hypothetical protein
MPQEFNLPNPGDPDYDSKVIGALQTLFDTADRQSKNFPPITTPEDGKQVGDIWFDEATGKLNVYTDSGVKVVKYE